MVAAFFVYFGILLVIGSVRDFILSDYLIPGVGISCIIYLISRFLNMLSESADGSPMDGPLYHFLYACSQVLLCLSFLVSVPMHYLVVKSVEETTKRKEFNDHLEQERISLPLAEEKGREIGFQNGFFCGLHTGYTAGFHDAMDPNTSPADINDLYMDCFEKNLALRRKRLPHIYTEEMVNNLWDDALEKQHPDSV